MSELKEFTSVESFKLCTKGLDFFTKRNLNEARKSFESGVEKFPDDMPTRFYYGLLLSEFDELQNAKDQFDMVALSPSVFAEGAKTNSLRIEEYLTTGRVIIDGKEFTAKKE